ncbi:MAG: histidinol-phosphatase [Clostridia bacterium]|nr:histidinol-phosphatase [Clostridia bacterium]
MLTESMHTHTYRCNHADGTEVEYIENAVRAGMQVLGFSDHAPYVFEGDYYSGFRMKREQVQDYFDTLGALRDEYAGRIDIHIGFEAEYYPKHFGEFEKLIRPYPAEYLIMGQHFIKNEYDGAPSTRETQDEDTLKLFVDQCSEGLATGLFACVAHPDVIHFTGNPDAYRREMRRLCENAKKQGVPLEINLLGIRTHRFYPNEEFWRIAGETGNDVVVGCDAHAAADVCDDTSYAIALELADRYALRLHDASFILKGGHTLL